MRRKKLNYNILIGGSAGQGMDTISDFIEKSLKKKDFMCFLIKIICQELEVDIIILK